MKNESNENKCLSQTPALMPSAGGRAVALALFLLLAATLAGCSASRLAADPAMGDYAIVTDSLRLKLVDNAVVTERADDADGAEKSLTFFIATFSVANYGGEALRIKPADFSLASANGTLLPPMETDDYRGLAGLVDSREAERLRNLKERDRLAWALSLAVGNMGRRFGAAFFDNYLMDAEGFVIEPGAAHPGIRIIFYSPEFDDGYFRSRIFALRFKNLPPYALAHPSYWTGSGLRTAAGGQEDHKDDSRKD